jgi:hypothetical protein
MHEGEGEGTGGFSDPRVTSAKYLWDCQGFLAALPNIISLIIFPIKFFLHLQHGLMIATQFATLGS